MNKKYLVSALLTVMILSGCASKPKETAEVALTPVEVTEISRGTIKNEYVYSGQVAASEQANVLSKMMGKVLSVNYDVGDEVAAGSVLFTIDTSDLQNNINVLRSQLASADASINSAQVNAELANGSAMQTQISGTKANIDQLKISLASAEKSYNDNKTLYNSGYISKQMLDQTENAYNQALIAYNQAKESYDILVNKTMSENNTRAASALEQAKAAKNSILAQIASLQDSLRDATVNSPISGVVTACNITGGALLSNASVPMSVAKIDVVTIDIDVSEQNINSIYVGQNVDVEISTLSDKLTSGTVSTINPVANPVTGTYAVRISINNGDRLLKPGMFGQVHFVKEKSENTLVVPRDAVIGNGAERYVFVEENGTVKKVSIAAGIDSGKEIEIISGLSEGQRIVVKGQTFLSDGNKVNAVLSEAKGE